MALVLICLVSLFACQRRSFNTDIDAKLHFSVDTVSFDTIFTTIGSATYHFKVYNTYKQDLEIDEIRLVGGATSNYRINIDGVPELSITNKLLRAQDSMYIFVDVNIDPTDTNLPFLVEDNILFNTNGTEQKVLLQSYGQDAHHVKLGKWGDVGFVVNENADTSYFVSINNDTTLAGDKPYLLHNDLVVSDGVELILSEGVRFYIQKDKNIDIYGSLQANGTVDNPVVFRGHRTDNLFEDTPYDKVPGQWGVLSLHSTSFDNYLKHTHIRNALIGLYVDSLSNNGNPKVKLENCRVENMTSTALYAVNADVLAENSIFANCEQNIFMIDFGGKYNFTHCTFANYYDWGSHVSPSVVIKNYKNEDAAFIPNDLQEANFTNCVIAGTALHELWFANKDYDDNLISAAYNYTFENCLLKTDVSSIDTNSVSFKNVIWNKDPLFRSPNEDWDFHPDTLSLLINAGKATHLISDLNEMPYIDAPEIDAPEIGALEYAGTLEIEEE